MGTTEKEVLVFENLRKYLPTQPLTIKVFSHQNTYVDTARKVRAQGIIQYLEVAKNVIFTMSLAYSALYPRPGD